MYIKSDVYKCLLYVDFFVKNNFIKNVIIWNKGFYYLVVNNFKKNEF